MKKKLVLAGGGHAHMMTLANLHRFIEKGIAVTVIGPSEFHYYSGMGPGMLGGTYRPEDIRFATRKLVESKGGEFIFGKIVRIEPIGREVILDSGNTVPYDVLSCNVGSDVPLAGVETDGETVFTVKPIEKLLAARNRILEIGTKQPLAVGIVGGGPSAVEIAGNIEQLSRSPGMKPVRIDILARSTLLPHQPPGIRYRAAASLSRRGVHIIPGCAVRKIEPGIVTSETGDRYEFDLIFVALGIKPNPVFKNSGIPVGSDGGLLVNRYLQSIYHHGMFGGGDCISFRESPLDKVGVYAVRQNPVLCHNLMAALTGGQLRPFDPGGNYLMILNIGGGFGILQKHRIIFGSRTAFMLKDLIDRRFMRKFQAFEPR